ncbi:recombination mediator RecR [Flexithrix dorotheae]|uniref:recombination mediator RecR n=1 Tax=Flexithrix dorotheae TaxID=70993 RepID=UPI00037EB711|nr:recombination mediator RecR [Flexithrix dorotheae]
MNFPSRLVEDAVTEISKLPGIGKKTALRLVLHLLKEEEQTTELLAKALFKLRAEIKYCKHCHNISDDDICAICSSTVRDKSMICIVESSSDVMAIENTSQYYGLYHVLGGVISPIEGIGPSDLNIDSLLERMAGNEVKEVILALNSTMEADTTSFYLTKKLKNFDVKITSIARGVPIGGELEFTDEITLGRSILRRVSYE